MKRRIFLKTISTAVTVGTVSSLIAAPKRELKIGSVEVKAGLKKTLKFLHVTDSHVLRWSDEIEDQSKLLEYRRRAFALSEKWWKDTLAYSKKNNLPILNTGDVYDFYNSESLKFLKNDVMPNTCVYAVGNHEFSRYCGSRKEVEGTSDTVDAVSKSVGYDVMFSSHVIDGLNILAINNANYQFNESQLKKLKAEIARGLPILAMFHIPIYTEKFFDTIFEINVSNPRRPRKCAYLAGVPEAKLKLYDKPFAKAHKPTSTTLEVAEILRTEPTIKGILCGHVHNDISDNLPSGGKQITSMGGYKGSVQEVVIS